MFPSVPPMRSMCLASRVERRDPAVAGAADVDEGRQWLPPRPANQDDRHLPAPVCRENRAVRREHVAPNEPDVTAPAGNAGGHGVAPRKQALRPELGGQRATDRSATPPEVVRRSPTHASARHPRPYRSNLTMTRGTPCLLHRGLLVCNAPASSLISVGSSSHNTLSSPIAHSIERQRAEDRGRIHVVLGRIPTDCELVPGRVGPRRCHAGRGSRGHRRFLKAGDVGANQVAPARDVHEVVDRVAERLPVTAQNRERHDRLPVDQVERICRDPEELAHALAGDFLRDGSCYSRSVGRATRVWIVTAATIASTSMGCDLHELDDNKP